MSGLEKFQASEAWRSSIKKFLFMERKPEIVKNLSTVSESKRYSMDISDDLKTLIEEKKNKKTETNINISTEGKSVSSCQTEEAILKSNISEKETMNRYNDTLYGECTSEFQKTSDESFEAIERMCNKTASDPNSTLFQYLHSDRQEQVLAQVKKRTSNELNLNSQKKEGQLLVKTNNETLLEDVEPPSNMWENSICSDTILQTSPVKRVGLLRPSTIIEEAPDDSANSDLSSRFSFSTASKYARSDVSSSAYETAHDSTEATTVQPTTLNNIENNSSNISIDLIDLEKTFVALQCSPQSIIVAENDSEDKEPGPETESVANEFLDDSIIEILTDDEDLTKNVKSIDDSSKNYFVKIENHNDDSFDFEESNDSDKENCVDGQETSDKSLQFNDTMEEVEYMMKKGMEYMAAESTATKRQENEKLITEAYNYKNSRKERVSPMKNKNTLEPYYSPLKAKSSPYTTPEKETSLSKDSQSSATKRFDIEMKPFPKFDIFLKPTKHAAGKQQKFSHIVSPVGAYMKKTAKTPLMSSMNCKTNDYFNSAAIRELEKESRLYKSKIETFLDGNDAVAVQELPGLTSATQRALPKKAYISSDLKHIVDERTPVKIPGGNKIQKYLENAMMPAVLRHDGKFKIPSSVSKNLATKSSSAGHSKLPLKVSDTNSTDILETNSHIKQRSNASLADLSLMSGDISLYTIKDAQKF